MKLFAIILLALAHAQGQRLQASTSGSAGFKAPGEEYLYRFQSQVLTGIPNINRAHHSGIKLSAQVKVQPQPDASLLIKFDQVKFMSLNGEIEVNEVNRIIGNGGPKSGAKEQLPAEFKQQLESPFKVMLNFKKGDVEKFTKTQNEHVAVTNIKRSLLAQQFDLTPSRLQETESNLIQVGAPIDVNMPYYSVMEQSLHGRCLSNYNVNPLNDARALELEQEWMSEEEAAGLVPSNGTKVGCTGKRYYEIIRTRDLNSCDSRPVYQKVSGADVNIDVSRTNAGNLMSHVDSTTAFVCGDLSSFITRKVIVDDTTVSNPIGYNTKQALRSVTQIMIELLDKTPITSPLRLSPGFSYSTSLEYEYPKHGQIPYEVVKETLQVFGTYPIMPQPRLTIPPILLIPVELNKIKVRLDIVKESHRIARELFSNPETTRADLNLSGRILALSEYMEIMSLSDLDTIWNQAVSGSSQGEIQTIIKELLLDTVAMVGTNPSTMFVLKKIEANEVSTYKSMVTLQAAINSIQTPTTELMHQLVNKVREWSRANTNEKQSLLTSALLQISNLFYHAYVNPETMAANYPVRIYGVFGTKHSLVLKNEFITALKQLLEQAKRFQDKHLQMVTITALGKLGHQDATKMLVEVAENDQEEPIVRTLAVYSMKRAAKRNPDLLINVLLAIINNPQEVSDVRIAALSVLPWAQPRYSELQEIAVRSWIEPSKQVASFVRSMLTNLQYTTEPELKPIANKVRGILHLLEPTQYGLQYSKHFDLSNFVEYLLASVSSRVSVVGSRSEPVPSRIESSTDLFLEALGEGLKLRTHSFKLYSQGFEKVIDEILSQYTNYRISSPEVKSEINKIARVINLQKRVAPQQMAFVQHNMIGLEYASLIRLADVQRALQAIKLAFEAGEMKVRFAAARNLVSLKVFGMNEAGFLVVTKIDNPTVFASAASLEKKADGRAKVVVRPVFTGKVQADSALVIPFTNEAVSTGVSMSVQASLPLEGTTALRQGELDLSLRIPEATKQSGKNVEILDLRVVPYTARKNVETVKPMSQSLDLKKIVSGQPLKQFTKEFEGLMKGNIQFESDNTHIDLYSYWEKLRQHNVPSLLTLGPLVSSVKMSSFKLSIQPSMCQMNEISLRLKLWARQTALDRFANPIGAQPMQEIKSKGMKTVQKTLEMLEGMHQEIGVIEPATVLRVQASLKGQSSVIKSYEAFLAAGIMTTNQWKFQPLMAANVKLPGQAVPKAFDLSGNITLTKFMARWNIDQMMQQAPELTLDAKANYGVEGQQEMIELNMNMKRSEKLVQSLRSSPEFKECQQLARQQHLLSPICSKVRQMAGSFDTAEVALQAPQNIFQNEVLRMVERLFKATLWANYRPIIPRPQLQPGNLKMLLDVERSGDVANIKIEHSREAYHLRKVRVPRVLQNFFPISARQNILDLVVQKATLDMAPATCRIESGHISTFDNATYSYNIPDCEHVLMMDALKPDRLLNIQESLPLAVLAKKQSGQGMMFKILAGKDQIQIGASSRGIEVLVNGQHKTIYPGQKSEVYAKDPTYPSSRRLVATIRRYSVDGVYHINVQQYGLKLVTDGKRVEVIAPQLLRSRTVGLCGNLDGETIGCVQSPGQCIMKPTLAAMSYMMNETNRCSVQGQFPGQLTEFQKELNACAKDKSVPTSLSPIFEKAMQENQAFGLGRLHGVNQNGKAYGEFDGFESELGMGSRIGMGIGGVSGGVGNKNLRCLSNSASCSSSSQCCSGNCHRTDMFSYACTPLRSSGTNGISNQEGAYVEQGNRDLSSSSSCIESRWDQLSRCDRDSDCCSKKCNIFRDSAYHCEPSTRNGVSGTQETGQIRGGCIPDGAKCGPGNDNCCAAKSTCHAVPYGFKNGNPLYGLRCASPRSQEGLHANQRCNKYRPCSQDSECCSGFVCTPYGYGDLKTCAMGRKHKSNSYAFGTQRDQERLYAQPRNLGCLGREYLCIASTQCCPGLKCRQIAPMLPFSRCQP